MKYNISENQTKYLVSNNTDVDDRWKVISQNDFRKQQGGCGDFFLRKTNTMIGFDDWIERSVIIKTINYSKDCAENRELILDYRESLRAQVQMLNDISSSMLPEPLDYFEVSNEEDDFSKFGKEIQDTEPVLVLDYIPGEVLAKRIAGKKKKAFYTKDDNGERLNMPMLMRLGLDIVAFIEDIYAKGYAYTSLSTDHIVLLLDNKPRFVGLSRICKVEKDRFVKAHPGFGRQLLGYSAPEMNTEADKYGENTSVKKVIAFNLGVILASVLAGVNVFDERFITNGAYDYSRDKSTRDYIQKSTSKYGRELDKLLAQMLDLDKNNRLCDFAEIKKQLMIISGEVVGSNINDSKVIQGRVSKIFYDRGYGFVEDNYGGSYYFKTEQMPTERYGQVYEGSNVSIIGRGNEDGKLFVSKFIVTDYICPMKPSLPEAKPAPRVPRTKVEPTPQPSLMPNPQPKAEQQQRQNIPPKGQANVSSAKPVIALVLIALLGIGIFVFKDRFDINKIMDQSDDSANEVASVEEVIAEKVVDTSTYINIIVPDGNVRSGPGTDYDAIAVVHENEQYIYTGNQEKPGSRVWYEIYLDEERTETGWVSSLIAEIQE